MRHRIRQAKDSELGIVGTHTSVEMLSDRSFGQSLDILKKDEAVLGEVLPAFC